MATKVGIVSLGCPKNTVDTENMLGLLAEAGYDLVADELEADLVLLNTCSFIEASQRESIQHILELGTLQKKLIVTGCLAQRAKGELLEELPEIHAAIGTSEFHRIVEVVRRVEAGERFVQVREQAEAQVNLILPRLLTSIGPSAYLKISEGCDHACAFCIIPALRGRYASRPMELIVQEARDLVAGGVRELVLVAEDTTRYGHSETGRFLLPELLEQLDAIPELTWIRVLYAYPNYMNDPLLETMARLERVVPYLDMPLQHSHPDMLKAMRRPRHEAPETLIARMRDRLPRLVLRTTFITGFPGETEAHHQHLRDFVEALRLDHVGAFAYSPQLGTAGHDMQPVVPPEVREARRDAIMAAQQGVTLAIHRSLIGQTLPMLVEAVETESGRLIGRTYRDAPEIDGTTYATTRFPAFPGDVVNVRITEVDPYDMVGVVVGS